MVQITDNYKIDSHKLMYHPARVTKWLEAENDWERYKKIYPVYLELSPFGSCNHRCVFCALDYVGYKPDKLDVAMMVTRIPEMAEGGVKSIMFGGEGEPLLHKEIGKLTSIVYGAGIDLAITTNGVKLSEAYCENHLEYISWIKVSINAGTPETYSELHRTDSKDFDVVINNLKKAVALRNKRDYLCTIGGQIILLPENVDEIEKLIRLCRDEIGLDYLVIKPYSQHMHSLTQRYKDIDYSQYENIGEKISGLSTESFQVIYRENTIANHSREKTYSTCYATPGFWAYVMANGDLYTCSAYLGDDRFNIGNIADNSFQTLWEGDRRKQNYDLIRDRLDIHQCRANCRMDSVNRYLWELVNPNRHVNFI